MIISVYCLRLKSWTPKYEARNLTAVMLYSVTVFRAHLQCGNLPSAPPTCTLTTHHGLCYYFVVFVLEQSSVTLKNSVEFLRDACRRWLKVTILDNGHFP